MSDDPTNTIPAPVQPDPEDIEAIEREYGPTPANATDAECADRWRSAQARKLIRLAGFKPAY